MSSKFNLMQWNISHPRILNLHFCNSCFGERCLDTKACHLTRKGKFFCGKSSFSVSFWSFFAVSIGIRTVVRVYLSADSPPGPFGPGISPLRSRSQGPSCRLRSCLVFPVFMSGFVQCVACFVFQAICNLDETFGVKDMINEERVNQRLEEIFSEPLWKKIGESQIFVGSMGLWQSK